MVAARIFIGTDISPDSRKLTGDYMDRLRSRFPDCRASWTAPEKLHFTVRFLGDVEAENIASVCDAARYAAGRVTQPTLFIEGTDVFPSPAKARVVWLGVKGELERMSEMKHLLDERLRSSGFDDDPKRFALHLTLGRIKDPVKCRGLVAGHLEERFSAPPFTVTELIVYESRLSLTGSIYTPIERIPLAEKA